MKEPDELEVAETVNGATPYVWFGTEKAITGEATWTVSVIGLDRTEPKLAFPGQPAVILWVPTASDVAV